MLRKLFSMFKGDDYPSFEDVKKKAAQGDMDWQFELGEYYFFGLGVQQDYNEAFKWLHLAATRGHPGAQQHIGLMYHRGEGVPRNDDEAFKWLKLSAEQGDSHGQYWLGRVYFWGLGVQQDFLKAHAWLSLSVAAGEEIAPQAKKLLIDLETLMSPEEIAGANRLARELVKPN